MTSARLLRLLLMAWVSFRRSPDAPEDDSLSDPARSMRLRTPSHFSSVSLLTPDSFRMKTLWLLEDLSLQLVLPTALFSEAFLRRFKTISGD